MVFKQPTFFGEPYEPESGADKDAALEEAVANALAVAGGIDAADVNVTLDDGAIVLTGRVATAAEIERATAVARAIAGTRPVRNEIKIA
ncbi:BON domain-containing protein [Rhizobium grahamii]|uniref:BON domain-containing protein n=1 Tax=Rhizobium grahamii TaxID=1120045 RepID=A0A370KLY3_9HYPH|nr:BON domain-containing protein [Rhizobium grahamii]RDJ09526.1 BON domain-containing protein [Rhizobium grahamii]